MQPSSLGPMWQGEEEGGGELTLVNTNQAPLTRVNHPPPPSSYQFPFIKLAVASAACLSYVSGNDNGSRNECGGLWHRRSRRQCRYRDLSMWCIYQIAPQFIVVKSHKTRGDRARSWQLSHEWALCAAPAPVHSPLPTLPSVESTRPLWKAIFIRGPHQLFPHVTSIYAYGRTVNDHRCCITPERSLGNVCLGCLSSAPNHRACERKKRKEKKKNQIP